MLGAVGPYRLERELGSGNMGVVYEVRHVELDARYALKVVRPELCDERDLARFQREIEQMAAASDVPGIVRIHSADRYQGRVYFVMDFVEGEALDAILRRGPLPLERAVAIVADVARGMATLHGRGIIHRDIKPANIMIDEGGRPRLADFGLARAVSDERGRLTRTGEIIGTPLYMSPEQARGDTVGPPADVYALGSVLFEAIAGQTAVQPDTTTLGTLLRVSTGQVRSLRGVAPDAPPALDDLCGRCLASDPGQRPSAGELADALQAFARGDAPQATPARPGGGRRLSIVALALLVALAAGGLATWLAARAGDPPPPAVTEDARAWLERARAALARPDPPDEALLDEGRAAAQALADPRDEEEELVRCEVLLARGELHLRRGEVERAAALLTEVDARAAEGGAAARLKTDGRPAALRAGLAAAGRGSPDEGLAHLEEASAAWARRDLPARPDFPVWRLRLLLRAEASPAELREARAAATHAPPGVVLEALLAARDLAEADRFLAGPGAMAPPAARARAHYALAVHTLNDRRAGAALAHLRQALRLGPEDARRAEVSEEVGRRRLDYMAWSKSGDPNSWTRGLVQEVHYHELRRLLDPDYRIPQGRYQVMAAKGLSVAASGSPEENMTASEGLIRLAVEEGSRLHVIFATQLFRNLPEGLGPPGRRYRLEILAEGFRLAQAEVAAAKGGKDGEARRAVRREVGQLLARAQRFLGDDAALRALLTRVEALPQARALEGYVRYTLGSLLHHRGRTQEALPLLREAGRQAPHSPDVRYAEFYYLREADPAGARTAGREFMRLSTGGDFEGARTFRRNTVAGWLSRDAEATGDQRAAARWAREVWWKRAGYLGWILRELGLLLALDPVPRDAVGEVLDQVARTVQDEVEPLRAKLREGRLAELRAQVEQLRTAHPPEPLPLADPVRERSLGVPAGVPPLGG